jgi:glycosyltransferase involved in cell wall biosynthesis
VSEIPEGIKQLLAARDEARAAKDFARADEIRDEIAKLGYTLRDTPAGLVVEKAAEFETVDPSRVETTLDNPAELRFSLHLLYEGFREDVDRFLKGLRAHNDLSSTEVVLVDNASPDGEDLEALRDDLVRPLHLDREVGWAAARNAGIKTSRGGFIVLVDLSIEPTGDILTPLAQTLSDDSVGLAGPFGLVSEKMRDFESSRGPEVDAIEGYLLATKREVLARGLLHEKFTWYRNCDIDLSFQIRSQGLKAVVVVDLPVRKHAHRGWEALSEEERAKRSKRNHYLFFDRWKHRHDLLLSHRDHPET